MEKLEIVKKAVSAAVGISVSFVVSNLIKDNVEPDNRLQQAGVQVGSFVLGAMVAEKATEYAQQQVQKLVDFYKSNSTEASE